jgi:predicted XRE-type DNA-binding protein
MTLKQLLKDAGMKQKFVGKMFGLSETMMSTLVGREETVMEIKEYLKANIKRVQR